MVRSREGNRFTYYGLDDLLRVNNNNTIVRKIIIVTLIIIKFCSEKSKKFPYNYTYSYICIMCF